MKKRFLLLALVMVMTGALTASAQNETKPVDYGIRAGVGLSTLTGDQVSGAGNLTTFNGGVFAQVNVSDYVAFQPELNLVLRGVNDTFNMETNTYKKASTTDLQVPFLFKFKLGNKNGIVPYANIGPAFNLNLSTSFTTESQMSTNKYMAPDANKVSVSAIGGVGMRFREMFIDFRYDMGLSNTYKWTETKSNVFAVSLGYFF